MGQYNGLFGAELDLTRTANIFAILLVISSVATIVKYWPGKAERWTAPTTLSWAIQKYVPWLYKPPAQVFAGRFGSGAIYAAAVIGPDCRRAVIGDLKILSMPNSIRASSCQRAIDLSSLMTELHSFNHQDIDWRYVDLKIKFLGG